MGREIFEGLNGAKSTKREWKWLYALTQKPWREVGERQQWWENTTKIPFCSQPQKLAKASRGVLKYWRPPAEIRNCLAEGLSCGDQSPL